MTGRSIALFVAAALAEIGGAYLMWQAVKEDRGLLRACRSRGAGRYGAIAALQPESNFGRVLAAYGGVFIIGSLLPESGSTPSPQAVARRSSTQVTPRKRASS